MVDNSGDSTDFGAQIKGVLKSGLPILGLVNSTVVSLDEFGAGLANKNASRKLSHGMHVLRQGLDQLLLISRQFTSFEHIFLECLHLRFVWHLSSEKEPQDTFWNGLPARHSFGSLFPDLEQVVQIGRAHV